MLTGRHEANRFRGSMQRPSLQTNRPTLDGVRQKTFFPLFALCFAFAAIPCSAADTQPTSATPTPPSTLTRESARDLLSRMSDAEVRKMLLEQLDRAAAPASPAKSADGRDMAGMAGMTGMAGMVGQKSGTARERLAALSVAFVALPSTLREAGASLASGAGALSLGALLGYVAVMLIVGWILERVYRYALREYRARRLQTPAATFSSRAIQLALGLLLDLGGIAVFALGAVAVFLARWLESEAQRVVVLVVLLAIVVVRVTALVARFLLTRTDEHDRLLPFADAPARTLRWFVIAAALLYSVGLVFTALGGAGAIDATSMFTIRAVFWIVGLAIALTVTWLVRRPIAELIRGASPRGSLAAWVADLWPVGATIYFLALFAGEISAILAGTAMATGSGFASILIVMAMPIVDMALCRALGAWAARQRAERTAPGLVAAYEPIFRRMIHIIVIIAGVVLIARIWHLDLFHIAQQSLGGRVASSLLGIGLVLLAAYMAWQITKMAIARRLLAEGERAEDVPATRVRTLLPILRATILVTIFVMASMSILAALGVDILPLLAGASVVGVAIGFGSQTLVRDVVSGAFFLMDDAFRLGEYIEVGDAKGRVEKINVRSVFLRHHRGALNILPYGEIKRLRNTSRDWQVHVMEFRLPYDTSMLQVKKIIKQIGEELAADPDYAADILQPLKSAGVLAAEDSAVVVRAKFTSRPTNNAWVVRRVAYDKIIRAFRTSGIKFAHRQVTVNVPAHESEAIAAAAGGAAAAAIESGKAAKS
jgi:small-conductance mechanosensitive channel